MIKKLIAISVIFNIQSKNIPTIDLSKNIIYQFKTLGLYKENMPLKLHLGCGSYHFDEYINIDLPPSEHTIQNEAEFGADVLADITQLNFPNNSLDEIRLHHLFEHFDRVTSLALLCKWHKWLKPGGILFLETPDFKESVRMFVSEKYKFEEIQSTIRHVFGSHEAKWAFHLDGWYKEKYEYYLNKLGFNNLKFEFTIWKLCPNIIVKAQKNKELNIQELKTKVLEILQTNMVDKSKTEHKMVQIWYKLFLEALEKKIKIGLER